MVGFDKEFGLIIDDFLFGLFGRLVGELNFVIWESGVDGLDESFGFDIVGFNQGDRSIIVGIKKF